MSDNKKCHEHHHGHDHEHGHQHDHHSPEMVMAAGCYDPLMGAQFELAKAYVKIQCYNRQFRPEVGLELGTIFPELYRPYSARGEQ